MERSMMIVAILITLVDPAAPAAVLIRRATHERSVGESHMGSTQVGHANMFGSTWESSLSHLINPTWGADDPHGNGTSPTAVNSTVSPLAFLPSNHTNSTPSPLPPNPKTGNSRRTITILGIAITMWGNVVLMVLCCSKTGLENAQHNAESASNVPSDQVAEQGDEVAASKKEEDAEQSGEAASSEKKELSVQEALRSISLGDEDTGSGFVQTVCERGFDAAVTGLCESPGIYTILWATRTVQVDQVMIFSVTLVLQIWIPCFLFPLSMDMFQMEFPSTATHEAKIAWPLLMVYMTTTISGTVDRMCAMALLKTATVGWTAILTAGVVSLIISSMCTVMATFHLFFGSPDITDMLLNVVAVNFIPDIDKSLVIMLGWIPSCARNLHVAKDRLAKFAEIWPESKERQELAAWYKQPLLEQCKTRPLLIFLISGQVLIVVSCFLAIFNVLYLGWFTTPINLE